MPAGAGIQRGWAGGRRVSVGGVLKDDGLGIGRAAARFSTTQKTIGGKFVRARLKQRPLLKKIFQSRKSGE